MFTEGHCIGGGEREEDLSYFCQSKRTNIWGLLRIITVSCSSVLTLRYSHCLLTCRGIWLLTVVEVPCSLLLFYHFWDPDLVQLVTYVTTTPNASLAWGLAAWLPLVWPSVADPPWSIKTIRYLYHTIFALFVFSSCVEYNWETWLEKSASSYPQWCAALIMLVVLGASLLNEVAWGQLKRPQHGGCRLSIPFGQSVLLLPLLVYASKSKVVNVAGKWPACQLIDICSTYSQREFKRDLWQFLSSWWECFRKCVTPQAVRSRARSI